MDKATTGNLSFRLLKRSELTMISAINYQIFKEKRLINSLNHHILISLAAFIDQRPVGFKIGYGLSNFKFYSAKGGVLPKYRRQGIATRLLYIMLREAGRNNFTHFYYDTFPENYPGMYHLGLQEGFKVDFTKWNKQYKDYQVRLYRRIQN